MFSRIRLEVRFDSVIDAVIISAIFALYQEIVAVGGQMTKVGVHWIKVNLHLETLLVSSKTMHIKGEKGLFLKTFTCLWGMRVQLRIYCGRRSRE